MAQEKVCLTLYTITITSNIEHRIGESEGGGGNKSPCGWGTEIPRETPKQSQPLLRIVKD